MFTDQNVIDEAINKQLNNVRQTLDHYHKNNYNYFSFFPVIQYGASGRDLHVENRTLTTETAHDLHMQSEDCLNAPIIIF